MIFMPTREQDTIKHFWINASHIVSIHIDDKSLIVWTTKQTITLPCTDSKSALSALRAICHAIDNKSSPSDQMKAMIVVSEQ